MKKIITLTFLLNFSLSSFAVEDQISSANIFLKKNSYISENQPVFAEIKKDIRVNQTSKEISLLQKQWGIEETGVYSKEMMETVKEQQKDLGLTPTGIIDPNTFMHLYNNPLSWKINVVDNALKEWSRVLENQENQPENYKNKFIVVNIPSQTLFAYEKIGDKYELQFETRVVVGTNRTRTPFETIYVTSLKYNPTWTPTNNIMRKNLLNKDGEINKNWIEKNKLIPYDKDGNEIALEDLSVDNKPARLIQPAGNSNALGVLKFETDSKNSIYLHDTNHKEIFNYNNRVASNGCIRVEDYKDLAVWLTNKSEDHINKNIAKEKTFFEGLVKVPVYTVYSQVWFYSNNPYFFADPYNLRKGDFKSIVNKDDISVKKEDVVSTKIEKKETIKENIIVKPEENNTHQSDARYKDVFVDSNNQIIRRTVLMK